jgi:hypothetical protein
MPEAAGYMMPSSSGFQSVNEMMKPVVRESKKGSTSSNFFSNIVKPIKGGRKKKKIEINPYRKEPAFSYAPNLP